MLGKRIGALLLLGMMLSITGLIGWKGGFSGFPATSLSSLWQGGYALEVEKRLQESFPAREDLSNLAWNLRFRVGAKEIDGYFIGETGMIKNVGEPKEELIRQNIANILDFSGWNAVPTYFMLLPTACAVKQHDLPDFAASTIYNQRAMIENVYNAFSGGLYTVDAYSVLLANQDKYLYYNTEDSITQLGGYYIYTALGNKLLGNLTPRNLDSYTVEYAKHDYYGGLQNKFPYAQVQPDILSLYHYRPATQVAARSYQVTRINEGVVTKLDDLYDYSALHTGQPLDVYLGGPAQRITVDITREDGRGLPSSKKLLIIGDETMTSYVPFLVPHYREIELLNLKMATPEQVQETQVQNCDLVLFAFSTDTFMHSEELLNIELLQR